MQDRAQTLQILEALANGVDPVTGEVFPAGAPYHSVDVVRALFNAVALLRDSGARKPSKPRPAMLGTRWTAQEDERLREAFLKDAKISELAGIHQRSSTAIRQRLSKLGLVDADGKRIVF